MGISDMKQPTPGTSQIQIRTNFGMPVVDKVTT